MRKIFSALDIGSNTIKLVVGEFTLNKLNILCAVKVPSYGFKANYITNKDALKESIASALDKVNAELNIKIKKVILNIPTSELEFALTDGVIDIEDEVVQSNDIVKLLKDVSKNKVSNNNEIICNIPITFKVDDQETTKPFGKNGNKLWVKSILVSTYKNVVYDLAEIVSSLGLEIIDLTTTGLVDYYNFKNKELDSKNVAVVNIGSTTTNISIFSKGIFINNHVLEDGGFFIDKEIASKFNLKRNETEYLKEKMARASTLNSSEEESLKVVNKSGEEVIINELELSKITEEKVSNLVKLIKNNINLLTKKEISYIIITGGLSELKDINLIINNELNKKGRIGNINNLGARSNTYSVALGMLLYFNNKLLLRNKDFTSLSEEEINKMCDDASEQGSTNTLISRVVGYFFDNW